MFLDQGMSSVQIIISKSQQNLFVYTHKTLPTPVLIPINSRLIKD